MGRVPDGLAAYESVLAPMTGDEGSTAGRVGMAKSWLEIVVDDLDGVPQTLAELAPAQLRNGSIRIAVWSYVWLSRAHYLLGGWDDGGYRRRTRRVAARGDRARMAPPAGAMGGCRRVRRPAGSGRPPRRTCNGPRPRAAITS